MPSGQIEIRSMDLKTAKDFVEAVMEMGAALHRPTPVITTDGCTECNSTGKFTRLGGDWGKTADVQVPCWACIGTGKV